MSDVDELTGRVMALIGAAVARDHEAVKDLLIEIAERHDAEGVWALCCALARMVGHALGAEAGAGDARVAVVDSAGRRVNPDQVHEQARPFVWANRFTAAVLNEQMDAALALFEVSFADDEQHAADVAALIKMAGDVVRSASSGAGER